MTNKILAVSLVLALIVSPLTGLLFVSSASANPYTPLHLPKITINSDGSITPQTSYINRTGNTYTLTKDIIQQYSIEISRSNIVFDGAGHMINVTVDGVFSDNGYPAFYVDVGINLVDVHNVLVRNVTAYGNNHNINLQGCYSCQIIEVTCKDIRILGDYNTVTDCNSGVSVFVGNNNLITKNNISYVFVGSECSSNKFYQNNFYLTDYPEFFSSSYWDNGSIGNYWSNYTAKYPNALELGNSGIGNTPYTIERGPYTTRDYPNVKSIDYFPLVYPWGAPEVTVFNLKNAIYFGSVPLNFSLNKPAIWTGYSLDGEENVTITGNFTLNGLATGFHNLTIFANDTFGEIDVSETIKFTVAPVPEPFPTMVAAAVSVAVASTVAGVLVYHKKHKQQETNTLEIK